MKKIISKKKTKNYLLIFTVIIVFAVIIYLKYDKILHTKKTYTIISGHVEKVSDCIGYVIKNENVIDIDGSKTLIPLIEQNKRVSKNGVLAIYKDEKYDECIKETNELDKTIETLVKDLPNSYSTEVSALNQQITNVANNTKNETSYLKMQEYKNKLDELAYKKVYLLAQNSPTGSKIRELIDKREKIDEKLIESSNNIKSPLSGVVTYKLDGLEGKYSIDQILKYGENDFKKMFSEYTNNNKNNYGIKICDNYMAYFITKTPAGENKEYIKEGKQYTIKTTEQDIYEFEAKLIKNVESGSSNYSIFEITNGIENIIDYRIIGMEIVWDRTEGLAVLNSAIKESENKKYKYVTLVYGGQYIDIPVKLLSKDENITIITNYSEDELKELGFERNTKISRYDIVVIE